MFLNSGDHLFNTEILSKCNSYLDFHDLVTFNIQMIEDKKEICESFYQYGISYLPNGIYIVLVYFNQNIYYQKIVVSH